MKVKLTSLMLSKEVVVNLVKTSSTTYSNSDVTIFDYSTISPILYCDCNVYMIDVSCGIIRVYTQTLNKNGKWSKAININNDIKAIIL